jgi:dTDP-L-rhamnose 4-epimerase
MKKILITGGAGFIGSNLANKLFSQGYYVRVLDNLSEQVHGKNALKESHLFLSLYEGIDFIQGDVCSKEDFSKALEDINYVYHFAAETGTGQSMYEISAYAEVNITGTAILLDTIVNTKNSVEKIVLSSSRSIYGEGKYLCEDHAIVYPNSRERKNLENGNFDCVCPICSGPIIPVPTDEDSCLAPSSFYGATKLTQEILLKSVCVAKGIGLSILRFQNVYGPGQSLKNPYTGILSIFSTQILNGKKLNIYEDGNESRDFVYIDDVVNACILTLDYKLENPLVLNIGSGLQKSVLEVASKLLQEYISNSGLEISGDFRLGDIRHNFADILKAKNSIKYQPVIDFEVGIKMFCEWVKTQPISLDNSEYAKRALIERNFSK